MVCRVFPSDFELNQSAITSAAMAREIQTLKTLQNGLSDSYSVFHSVHWTRVLDSKSRALGEIDFIVMNRSGELLLIEQKTGPLLEAQGDLLKSYSPNQAAKSITFQLSRNQDGLLTKYRKLHNTLLNTTNVLYCPDYKILEAKVSGLDRNQIIDSSETDLLCQKLMKLLPGGQPSNESKQIERFLKNELLIQEDLVRISGAHNQLTTRIAGGLSGWVARLTLDPYKLRVQGTAGSGKTQLAVQEIKVACTKGLKALYVSFNRPLARHMKEIFEGEANVTSLFSFCEELVRAEDSDLAKKRGYVTNSLDDLFELAASIDPPESAKFDLVVVDEGQDFTQQQADFLISWAKPLGKVIWLEDPVQNIYQKPRVSLPNWALINAPVNYRNPKPIAELLHLLLTRISPESGDGLGCANPFEGLPINYLRYDKTNGTDMKRATESAIASFLSKGFNATQISVLSFKGQAKSTLLAFDKLNGLALKKPIINKVDEYTTGELETDTLFRYKGLSNLAIVLTEVEFEELNERVARLLFVGASRAKLALAIVHDSPLEKTISTQAI
ncbi:AAA domain-containing protein [Limnobacter thiooxidans]|uniref:DNA 3'-5' helicase II n=1 Tax=Limnobacter thiooxidans TaxID=131080 RepID=A0AA86J3L0_9BURK|nr:AAA domain-containing protein [Limnobacter thiooxidans]BET26529.1 ATP-dependent helicase [Limnobacter thiooxidans]